MGLGSWSRVRAHGKRYRKEVEILPYFKILFILGSPKMFMMAIFTLANLSGNSIFQHYAEKNQFPYFSCVDLIFVKV